MPLSEADLIGASAPSSLCCYALGLSTVDQAACTKSLSVFIRTHEIKLDQNKIVTVDGVKVTLPYTNPSLGLNIIHASSLFVQVCITSAIPGVSLSILL